MKGFEVLIKDAEGNYQKIGDIDELVLNKLKLWIRKFGRYFSSYEEEKAK